MRTVPQRVKGPAAARQHCELLHAEAVKGQQRRRVRTVALPATATACGATPASAPGCEPFLQLAEAAAANAALARRAAR